MWYVENPDGQDNMAMTAGTSGFSTNTYGLIQDRNWNIWVMTYDGVNSKGWKNGGVGTDFTAIGNNEGEQGFSIFAGTSGQDAMSGGKVLAKRRILGAITDAQLNAEIANIVGSYDDGSGAISWTPAS